jgi:large subunit ribosomal protein L35
LTKRLKVTAGGKIKHRRPGGGHLLSGKSAKRRRRIGTAGVITGTLAKKFISRMGK